MVPCSNLGAVAVANAAGDTDYPVSATTLNLKWAALLLLHLLMMCMSSKAALKANLHL